MLVESLLVVAVVVSVGLWIRRFAIRRSDRQMALSLDAVARLRRTEDLTDDRE